MNRRAWSRLWDQLMTWMWRALILWLIWEAVTAYGEVPDQERYGLWEVVPVATLLIAALAYSFWTHSERRRRNACESAQRVIWSRIISEIEPLVSGDRGEILLDENLASRIADSLWRAELLK